MTVLKPTATNISVCQADGCTIQLNRLVSKDLRLHAVSCVALNSIGLELRQTGVNLFSKRGGLRYHVNDLMGGKLHFTGLRLVIVCCLVILSDSVSNFQILSRGVFERKETVHENGMDAYCNHMEVAIIMCLPLIEECMRNLPRRVPPS